MESNTALEARRREHAYAGTALALAVVAALLHGREWAVPAAGAALAELAAAVLAIVCGLLSIVRHYSRRERHFLFVGVTFLGAGLFDAFQVLALLRAPGSPLAAAAAAWGWFGSRLFLSMLLARLAMVPRRPVRAELELDESVLYLTALLLTAVGLSVLLMAPLTPPGRMGGFLAQLIPALFLLLALAANLRRGGWRRNGFEHWLIISILLGLGAQLLAGSLAQPIDSLAFLAGRAAKLLSYAAIFAGLLASVYFTYGALEDSGRALAAANRALQREVHDRQATERELQIRTAFLEHLFESTPEAIVILDREDRVQRINPEFTRLFGFTPQDALGRPIGSLIVPPECAAEAESFSAGVALGETVAAETVRMRADGSLVYVSILGTPVLVADGQIGVYGIYRDITDRKRAEDAMRRSAERLAAIIEASPLAIFTMDADGIVRTWNPAAAGLSGLASMDAIGRPLAGLPLGAAADIALGERSTGAPVEMQWSRRNGQLVHVSIATAPLEGADGTHDTLVVAADVTERRRAEEVILRAKAAAEEASRSKSEFLASMSHELRTPLNSVIGFTKVLLRNKAGNLGPTDVTYLERISANGEHLLALINNILDLSKVEAGMLQVEMADTEIPRLVQETVAQLEGRVTGTAVELRAELPDAAVPIATDAHRLRQVLINLIGNALKFTDEGEVVVRVEGDESGVPRRIRVTDTGIGIPADRLGVIFEAFEQADRSTTRRYGGTGLGLSISRGICQQLGYDLTVESEPGVGSTFTIHLATADVGREPEAEVAHA